MQNEHQTIVSFDRLVPSAAASEHMCAKVSSDGYRALSVPPTITLGPLWAEQRAYMSCKEEAIENNVYLAPERKQFLKTRIAYWDSWAKLESKGTLSAGDYE